MDLGAFDLNTLDALRALLEEGNLTHAGAKVGLAQPAMSQVLGRYRRHFDDELLVRVGREYELTPLARDLLPHVQEALRLLRATLRVDETFDPATSDRLFTVAASDYAMTVLLAPPGSVGAGEVRGLLRCRGRLCIIPNRKVPRPCQDWPDRSSSTATVVSSTAARRASTSP